MALTMEEKPIRPNKDVIHIIGSDDAFLYLLTHPTTIIYASPGATADSIHPIIRGRFTYWHEPPIPIGVIDLVKLTFSSLSKSIVTNWLSSLRLNLDMFGKPPSGYYLFVNGKLIAYHSASIDLQTDEKPLAVSIFSIAAAILTKSKEILDFGIMAATLFGAARAVKFFEECLSAASTKQPSSESPHSKLQEAYKTLGLSTTATDEDVIAVHRKLVLESHPNRCHGDNNAVAGANRLTAEINVARDIILSRPPESKP